MNRNYIKTGIQTGLPVYSEAEIRNLIDTLDENEKIDYIQELSAIIGIPAGEWNTRSVFLVSTAALECKVKAFLKVKKQ